MALVRSAQSLDKIGELYRSKRKRGGKKLTSFYIEPNQKEIIDLLAEDTGKGKAEVMRDMIDEWVEMHLRKQNPQPISGNGSHSYERV